MRLPVTPFQGRRREVAARCVIRALGASAPFVLSPLPVVDI
jgi:hypothetical protein